MIQITLERMAKILGVTSPSDYEEVIFTRLGDSNTYSVVYQEALNDDCSEEEAEEKALAAEQRERDEAFQGYVNRLVNVFEQEAANLSLDVSPLKTKEGVYALTPQEGWTKSAAQIRSLVYGIAGWSFTSFKEFLASGPYTPRKAVDQHLAYLGERWKLYGYASPVHRVATGSHV